MVGHEYMAAGFCIQGKYGLVDIYFSGCISIADRIDNNKFPGNKSGDC